MKTGIRYCAFLRGINVGGHAVIKMEDLKTAFENMGLESVRTLLASGNVVFESGQSDQALLARKIEAGLKAAFKRDIAVILRRVDDLRKIRSSEPFRDIRLTPDVRLYVTFLPEGSKPRATAVPPASAAQAGFRILDVTPGEIYSVVDLSKGKGTVEAMGRLEKEFGTKVTTRNWNTVLKILESAEGA